MCEVHSFPRLISNDIPKIQELMELSIRQLLGPLLTTSQLEASFDSMGLDDQLIKDGTYFMVFKGDIFVVIPKIIDLYYR